MPIAPICNKEHGTYYTFEPVLGASVRIPAGDLMHWDRPQDVAVLQVIGNGIINIYIAFSLDQVPAYQTFSASTVVGAPDSDRE